MGNTEKSEEVKSLADSNKIEWITPGKIILFPIKYKKLNAPDKTEKGSDKKINPKVIPFWFPIPGIKAGNERFAHNEGRLYFAIKKLSEKQIFEWIDPDFLFSLIKNKVVPLLKYKKGETVIQEWSDENSSFFVVVNGSVDVFESDSNQSIAEFASGEPVGYYAFFEWSQRTATVIAKGQFTMLLEFDKSILLKYPILEIALLRNFAKIHSKKMREIDDALRVVRRTINPPAPEENCRTIVDRITCITECISDEGLWDLEEDRIAG